jgi:hypothetical protein
VEQRLQYGLQKTMAEQYRYVAGFDIRSYYESINRSILLKQLQDTGFKKLWLTMKVDV